ncbi:uncharacterized protein LOC135095187 isoform X1 [Scylla paramamosain]|uniref:uncharacterized protein LOC135095187 isoform X1 n=1 Tax=Scylla paramamosain TaxID=85552 RepID=UPI003083BF3F
MGRSTHLSILWTPTGPTTSTPRPAITRTHRPMPESALREFGQWVTQHLWTEVLDVEDVHSKWHNYVATTTEAFHRYFPAKSVTVHTSDAPWMTPRIKRLMHQRTWSFHSCPDLYGKLRNRVIREIKAAKASYYPDKIHHFKQANNRQWYASSKALCGLQKHTSSLRCTSHLPANLAAQEMNDHFAAICHTYPPLHTTPLPAHLPAPSPSPTVLAIDVFKRILKDTKIPRYQGYLKIPRSTTPTDLPIWEEPATPLCPIINASLSQHSCPADWKTSYVSPIRKASSPQSLGDLRPVSITPIPSFICEDFVYDWAYTKTCYTVDIRQFGNIKATSTSHYLTSFLDFIHSHLDKRNTSLPVAFVDFKKAFDLVDQLCCLQQGNESGSPSQPGSVASQHPLREASGRSLSGSVSNIQQLTCGVPQGTKMSPLCFLLLTNDALTDTPMAGSECTTAPWASQSPPGTRTTCHSKSFWSDCRHGRRRAG